MPQTSLSAHTCPVCSAPIEVSHDHKDVICKYCGSSIAVERDAPPAAVVFGAAQKKIIYIPRNQVAQIEKATAAATKASGCLVTAIVVAAIAIPLVLIVGGFAYRGLKGKIHPFPATCDPNEELHLSGDFSGPGAAVTVTGANCKVWISNSHIKSDTFIDGGGINLEIHLDNVTVETKGIAIKNEEVNTNVTAKNTTITSTGAGAMSFAENADVRFDGGGVTGQAFAIQYGGANGKLKSKGSTFKAKDDALIFAANGGFTLSDKGRVEGGRNAIVSGESLELKIDNSSLAAKQSMVTTSGYNANIKLTTVDATGATVAFAMKEGGKLDLLHVKISASDTAIAAKRVDLTAEDTTIDGDTAAIAVPDNAKIELKDSSLKSRGTAFSSAVNSSIEAANSVISGDIAIGATSNANYTFAKKTKVTGRSFAVKLEGNARIKCDDSQIDASDGTALVADINAQLTFAHDCKVHGKTAAVDEKRNGHVTVTDASVSSEGIALKLGGYDQVTLSHATIQGGQASISKMDDPNTTINITDSTITGPQKVSPYRSPFSAIHSR